MKVQAIIGKDSTGSQFLKETAVAQQLCKGKVAHRQLSFMGAASYERLRTDKIKGFCHHKFIPNFVVKPLDMKQFEKGQHYSLGNVIIEISELQKECHFHCPAFIDNSSCYINRQVFFALIVKEGHVTLGDSLEKIE